MVLRTDATSRIEPVVASQGPVALPAHLEAEVWSVLRRLHRSRRITLKETAAAVGRLASFPGDRYALAPLLDRALSLRDRVGAHDAFYGALAARLGCPLLTCDRGLARALEPGLAIVYLEPTRF